MRVGKVITVNPDDPESAPQPFAIHESSDGLFWCAGLVDASIGRLAERVGAQWRGESTPSDGPPHDAATRIGMYDHW